MQSDHGVLQNIIRFGPSFYAGKTTQHPLSQHSQPLASVINDRISGSRIARVQIVEPSVQFCRVSHVIHAPLVV